MVERHPMIVRIVKWVNLNKNANELVSISNALCFWNGADRFTRCIINFLLILYNNYSIDLFINSLIFKTFLVIVMFSCNETGDIYDNVNYTFELMPVILKISKLFN